MDSVRITENNGERDDVVPELPAGPSMAAASLGDAFHQHRHPRVSIPETPADEQNAKKRRGSQSSQAVSPTSILSPVSSAEEKGVPGVQIHRRRGSTASRVAIDHFDPEGFNELKRTMTEQSAHRSMHEVGRSASRMDQPPLPAPRESSIHSAGSTAVSEAAAVDPAKDFDFERHLRDMMTL